MLAAANRLASAPPNRELLCVVVGGLLPNTDDCVGVPPNTDAWVVAGDEPNTRNNDVM